MALGLSLIHTTGHTQSHVKGQPLALCVFPLFTPFLSARDVWDMYGHGRRLWKSHRSLKRQ